MAGVTVLRLAALTFALLLTGCAGGSGGGDGGAGKAPDVAVKTIVDGTLRACSDVPYEPFVYLEDGRHAGIEPDLLRALAQEMRLNSDIVDVNFEHIFTEMEAGKCDLVVSAVSITDERKQKYLFTDPYFEINQSLLVRSGDEATLKNLAGLTGKVGVKAETTGAEYVARQLPADRIVAYPDTPAMLQALREKEVDGIVQDRPVNLFWARQPEFAELQVFTDVEREQYGMVLPKRSQELRDAVNSALRRVQESGRSDEILQKHLGGKAQR